MYLVKKLSSFERNTQQDNQSLQQHSQLEVERPQLQRHQEQEAQQQHQHQQQPQLRDTYNKRSMETEKELNYLNKKIEKLLTNIRSSQDDTSRLPNQNECVVCLSSRATMKTLPCGHSVVCRTCFIRTIQTSVNERQFPLRCVLCRTKILKLKQLASFNDISSPEKNPLPGVVRNKFPVSKPQAFKKNSLHSSTPPVAFAENSTTLDPSSDINNTPVSNISQNTAPSSAPQAVINRTLATRPSSPTLFSTKIIASLPLAFTGSPAILPTRQLSGIPSQTFRFSVGKFCSRDGRGRGRNGRAAVSQQSATEGGHHNELTTPLNSSIGSLSSRLAICLHPLLIYPSTSGVKSKSLAWVTSRGSQEGH